MMAATEVKELPILFNDEMVRAILDGRKTQTRRVVHPKHVPVVADLAGALLSGRWEDRPFPYGRPGDRLWVREAWAPTYASANPEYPLDICYFEWDAEMYGPLEPNASGLELCYRADGEDGNPAEFSMPDGPEIRWRPSIHMPRWASRITLEITGVRVERVQEITPMDAVAEGVGTEWDEIHEGNGPRDRFAALWNSINAGRGYGWDANPWVWCISFRRVEL